MIYRFHRAVLLIAVFVAATTQAQFATLSPSASAVTWSVGTNSRTVSYTVPAVANRALMVAVHMNIRNMTNAAVASVTYGGTALTLVAQRNDGNDDVRAELWGLAAPPVGTAPLVVTLTNVTGTVPGVIGAFTFRDILPALTAGPFTNIGNNVAPSVTVTGTTAGDYTFVVGSVRQNTGGVTASVGPGQTEIYNANSAVAPDGADVLALSSQELAAGASTTLSYALAPNTNRRWIMIGAAVRPVSTDVQITGYGTPDLVNGTPTTVTFVYTISAPSAGANNVNFAMTLPAGLTIVSATPSQGTCTPGATTNCSLGNLVEAGASATVTLVATTGSGGVSTVYTTTANVSSGTTDVNAANNSATVAVQTQGRLCANPGIDGNGGAITGSVNTYFPATATAAAQATAITLGAVPAGYGSTPIAAGDLLLVIQMQDAAINSNNDDRYGDGAGTGGLGTPGSGALDLANAGRYEYVVATNAVAVTGGTLNLRAAGINGGLIYGYTSAAPAGNFGHRRYQVIRVPQYASATLAAGTGAPAWNGSVGGVFAVDVSGTLTMGSNAGTGTVATTLASPTVTGTGTAFLTQVRPGDRVTIAGEGTRTVLYVESNTILYLATNATTTGTGRTFTVPTVSVSGRGFRGGAGRGLGGGAGANTDYRTLATVDVNAMKGEGIAGTPRHIFNAASGAAVDTGVEGYPNGSAGRGAPSNGGGGGTDGNPGSNDENSGGGGGGNAGNGGKGGNAWRSNTASGGFGGSFESPSPTRLILGGGGGAGTTNNSTSDRQPALGALNSSGAAGGGVVILRANQISGTGTIAANGGTGFYVQNDAGGGAGAGGTIVIDAEFGTLGALTLEARGGNGGNAWLTQANPGYPGERHGPGGGGGGGAIYISKAAGATDVAGGTAGLTTTANDNFGATNGLPGLVSSPIAAVAGAAPNYGCALADLTITDSASATYVQPSQNVTFTQVVVNNGPNPADQVTVSIPVPASATFQSFNTPAGWTCVTPLVGASGIVSCTTTTLASAASASFSMVVQAHPGTPAGYTLSQTVSVTSQTNESNYGNNTATAAVAVAVASQADIAVSIAAPATAVANTNYTYTATAVNNGPASAAGASFSTTTPAGTTFSGLTPPAGWTCVTPAVGGTGTITCTASSPMPAGASVNFPIVVHTNAGLAVGTVIPESGTVSTTTSESNTLNNSASGTTTIVGVGTADLAVTLTALTPSTSASGLVSFSETVRNNGVVASGGSFTQVVPANTTFVSMPIPAGWTCVLPSVGAASGTAITCTSTGTIAVNASATFVPTFQVVTGTATNTTITQTATISTTGGVTDSIAANNSANASSIVRAAGTADLAITKSDSPDPVGQGQLVNYVVTVVNNGPEVATGITVSDPLPASMSFVSVSPSQGTCSGTTTINCSLGSLAVRGTATVTIIVQTTATGSISNTATVSGTLTDPVAANNTASATTTVLTVTLVRMREVQVVRKNRAVQVRWRTEYESDNLGFNVYREVTGQRTRLNREVIAGAAFGNARDIASHGYGYRYTDRLVNDGASPLYWIEDVDLSGMKTLHGPYTSILDSSLDQTAPDSPSLPGLGSRGSVIDTPAGYGTGFATLPPPKGPALRIAHASIAAGEALKIYVDRDGFYRVTKAAMSAAGYDAGVQPSALALYTAGVEQPLLVNDGGDGSFDARDSIEFYGVALDGISTGARTYWLATTPGRRSRIATSAINGGDPVTESVSFRYERIERGVFFAALTNNGEGTNFFGPVITSYPVTQDLPLGNADTTASGSASLDVTLQGGTDIALHRVAISLNGRYLGTAEVNRQEQKTFSYAFAHDSLRSGNNSLEVTALGGDDDVSVLVSTRVNYRHLLRADNDAFQAELPGNRITKVAGFSTRDIRAFDVTDPTAPVELKATVADDPQGGFTASFTSPVSGPRKILVAGASRIFGAPEVVRNIPSSLSLLEKSKQLAMVIITNAAFTSAANQVKTARAAEGLQSAVVDVEDIYDEYNFGIRDAAAIRSFLADAISWKSLRNVLLVGDASIDPRNYLGLGAWDFVPTKLVATTYLKTASDDWFADMNGDGVADIAIGRLPVRSAADASLVAGRIAARGIPSGPWAKSVLFVADQPEGYDFAGASASIRQLVPAAYTTTVINAASVANPASAIAGALNDGQLVVNYLGHGSTEVWGNGSIFSSSAASSLANAPRLPFVVVMNCLNGYFHDLYTESLAEALLKAPRGGAIAVWASSSLTQPDQQAIMDRELFRLLFGSSRISLGEAVRQAKLVTSDPDVKKSWIFFGDPSMTLK